VRVLHVLHTSLPFLCGYTVRSDRILRIEQEQGMDPAAVTSAQHPGGGPPLDEVGGLPHWRTPPLGEHPPFVREWRLMRALERRIDAAIGVFRPALLHAHSPVLVGLPALRAARRHGVPLVYEVRDLWENASVDRGKFGEGSARYAIARSAETWLLRRADAVVTICELLREELAYRLARAGGISVVPNGVDTTRFAPRPPREDLRARFGLRGKTVIGYVGTFQPYEGLTTLVAAMPRIAEAVPSAHWLIVGGGGEAPRLRAEVLAGGLGARVTFAGQVPHEEIVDVYPLIDLLVYPRLLTRTTALTTPLKPLEAMAMARPVLASDVPAMRELVRPGETGSLFRAGESESLAAQAIAALGNPEWQRVLADRARAWVERERRWPDLVRRYHRIYEDAFVRAGGRVARAPARAAVPVD
jgi:PEP-CTERM/exosortase A-associated glycosyltransferase